MNARRSFHGLAIAAVGSLLALSASALQAATVQVTVLGRDGQPLPDAVVVIELAGNAARPATPAPVAATITQQKMQFLPALSVLPLGSTVRFVNLDSWDHHTRGQPTGLASMNVGRANTEAGLVSANTVPKSGFELRLNGRVDGKEPHSAEVTLSQAGALQLGCHIHGSMRGSIFVADTPWAVKTGADGVASVSGVPDGAALVRIWHADQLLAAAPNPITVTPILALTVTTDIVARRRRAP